MKANRPCAEVIIVIQSIEEKLIAVVSGFPLLYDTTNIKYRDCVAKEEAWTQVAAQVGLSGKFGEYFLL